MERPLTIAGLQAKREELAKLHQKLEDEAAQVRKDMGHVEACIRLFDPEAQMKRVCMRRYHKPRQPKGQLRRFILDQLRASDEPLT